MANHYDTLGVPKDADKATIKRAFRKKRSKAHPDRAGGDTRAMVALNRAYDTLSDDAKRERYDQTGQDSSTPPPPPLDARARNIIMAMCQLAMEQVDEHTDVISVVRQQIPVNKQQIQKTINDTRQKAQKLERHRKRVRYKGEERNFIVDGLDQRISALTQQADQAEEALKASDRALELLKDFSYETDDIVTFVFNLSW